ncbi:MAG: copper oxidase [Acidobacteriota bacterium]
MTVQTVQQVRNQKTSGWLAALVMLVAGFIAPAASRAQVCNRTVHADVAALDQVFFWNRLGASQPQGQIYALARDVFPDSVPLIPAQETIASSCATAACTAGQVHLRSTKRPRPLTLRMNVGDCLDINFTNLINPVRANVKDCPTCIKGFDAFGNPIPANADEQPATRTAGMHAIGLQLATSIASDGSNVGANASSLVAPSAVPPNQSQRYVWYAGREGQHVINSTGAMTGGDGDGGQTPMGLFGAVDVEPAGASWLRSQVTAADIIAGLDTANANSCASTPGYTCDGHPLIDYDALDAEGTPIFKMLDAAGNIVHTDLTAIISGPFTNPYPANPSFPDRDQSFREFTLIYHDEIGAVQAFPQFFNDPVLTHTTHSVRDAFAINYGTGGIGSEILANRLGVGPEATCTGCKYEEFFLTAWAVGDPAEVVDIPANACLDPLTGQGDPNCRATRVLYPDDPSNVYHSYISDHTKFRILHAGPKEHHIHHLHAHQWLYAPDSDNSAYLDSQAIGPGASFTLEMVYNGSGNRNQTVGDSIFHCHFYPHFAMGMWSLWRVHDVFEDGTRMLPDGEIAQGTPIPGLVPIPGLAMAPVPAETRVVVDPAMPQRGGQVQVKTAAGVFKFTRDMTMADVDPDGDGNFDVPNPGYPFFIPGLAGSRPPHPPLDTIDDGGLPRHVLLEGAATEVHTRLDFTKELDEVDAAQLDEGGEPIEQVAMAFHGTVPGKASTPADRFQPTVTTDGTPAQFKVNGSPAVAGAPYAEPCIDDAGLPVGRGMLGTSGSAARLYKAADIQVDTIFNKSGWHFPQQRMITLWDDVDPTFAGTRPPEPFFIRANSGECIEYQLTNLVPNVYELDDFQVRTPTDILGQHIHLVKFDVTSSDGSANGWNYEDGSFSPDEVIERINAINQHVPAGITALDGTRQLLTARPHPRFPSFVGAQTTVQRWWADPVLNNSGEDRTLRTVFTHDHFGPSTHQQAGLYAGLVVEPTDSLWFQNESGVQLGTRATDGGPTSWQAVIDTTSTPGVGPDGSYREFMFEFQDFTLAYTAGGGFVPPTGPGTGPVHPLPWNGVARLPGEGFDDRPNAINPPARIEVGLPDLVARAPLCPGGVQPPCPEGISADDPGTFSVNYRNEPVAMRVRDPQTNSQAAGDAGDLSLAFSSLVTRADPDYNVQPGFYPPLTAGLDGHDPFTPMMRAYDDDHVQIRVLVGAHEEGHIFSIHGVNWKFEPSWADSGNRNAQMMGISEHFEFLSPLTAAKSARGPFIDYLYEAGTSSDDIWNGMWGILRSYNNAQTDLPALPNNPAGGPGIANAGDFAGVCPKIAPERLFDVTAVLASDVLGPDGVVYNSRTGTAGVGPLTDPTAILLVRSADLDKQGVLAAGTPIEPIVLRARAGDCIEMVVRNNLPAQVPDQAGFNTMPMIVDGFNANDVMPSARLGLHAQLVATDVSRDDGAAVGFQNLNQLTPPQGNQKDRYFFYAGTLETDPATGNLVATPVEFGASNLISSDPIKHSNKGLIGSLIIEPQNATWTEDAGTRLAATVCPGGESPCTMAAPGAFREFVTLFQTDVNLRCNGCGPDPADPNAVPSLAQAEDPEDSGQKAINYATEPFWFRFGFAPDTPLTQTRDRTDMDQAVSNTLVGGDPQTPIFLANAGDAVRFRLLSPAGHARNIVFALHGHVWQQEPWINGSTQIGDNALSLWEGAQMGHGPANHFDAVLENGAGGLFKIGGDYLFRDQVSFGLDAGLWGLFRVTPLPPDPGGAASGGTVLPPGSWDEPAPPPQ